eukprot:SAG31_NODE_38028_length_299_cov_1.190000_1_plen_23_part_01
MGTWVMAADAEGHVQVYDVRTWT